MFGKIFRGISKVSSRLLSPVVEPITSPLVNVIGGKEHAKKGILANANKAPLKTVTGIDKQRYKSFLESGATISSSNFSGEFSKNTPTLSRRLTFFGDAGLKEMDQSGLDRLISTFQKRQEDIRNRIARPGVVNQTRLTR